MTIFAETIYNVTYPLYAYLHEAAWAATDIHLCGYLIFICHSCHTEEQGVEEQPANCQPADYHLHCDTLLYKCVADCSISRRCQHL